MAGGYREDVLKDYHSKRSNGSLSPNLMTPTPASIRDECLLVFARKRDSRDMKILRLFVDDRGNAEDYDRALRNADVSKFKPLRNFLLDPNIQTTNKNVELLAWLIDYSLDSPSLDDSDPERKTNDSENTTTKETLEPITSKESLEIVGGSGQHKKPLKPAKASKQNIIILLFIIIAITFILLGQRAPNNLGLSFLTPDPSCMYWNGYNYVGSNECTLIEETEVFNKFVMDKQKWISCASPDKSSHAVN